MSKYEKLFEFISYFEKVTPEKACHWAGGKEDKDGVIHMLFPIYDGKLEEFIHTVYETDLIPTSHLLSIVTEDNHTFRIDYKVPGC